MNRRRFLGAMLAACAAPAIVRAESIMRIAPALIVPDTLLGTPMIFRQYPNNLFLDPLGERLQLVREMIIYGSIKAATDAEIVQYGSVTRFSFMESA